VAAPSAGTASGTVIAVNGDTFTVQSHGRRMGVVNALVASAAAITKQDYPYVWGGGHAQAGVASVGSAGPGHNGRRVGYDCSGSVAAVLAGAGLWPVGTGVPGDAGVISYLRAQGLIARGPGQAPVEVTLYDNPGVHIFMNIDGRFFGTSDGGGGGNPKGGAGWLYDGAWDATSRSYRKWHFLPRVLRDRTTYGHDFTFVDDPLQNLAGELAIGDRVRVGWAQNTAGGMSATALSWVGQLTAGGTVTALSADGGTLAVQTPSGSTLNLTVGGFSWLLQNLSVGDGVSVTYTRRAGVLTLRQVTVTAAAAPAQVGGTITAIASDSSSFTVQTSAGQSLTFSTGGDTTMLSGVSVGDGVLVTYVQTPSNSLIAQGLTDQGSAAGSTPTGPGAASGYGSGGSSAGGWKSRSGASTH
jgi:hypothetical protein